MKKLKEKIGFIGCGNMGCAILAGLLKNKIVNPNQIYIHEPVKAKAGKIKKKYRIHVCNDNAEAAGCSEIIILAIKPQELRLVSEKLRGALKHQLVISILAGTPISKIKKLLGKNISVVRAMPNLGAVVGKAVTAVTGDRASAQKARLIFSGCGAVVQLKEKFFNLVTAVSGSGPAYFFLLMELLTNFARKNGLTLEQASCLAIGTAVGAAALGQESSELPEILRKRVTSKGGTTEAAISYLFENKAPEIFCGALQKAIKRAEKLSKG